MPKVLKTFSFVCACVRVCAEFVYFILGNETGGEVISSASSPRLRHRIIERCDHISDEVVFKVFENVHV